MNEPHREEAVFEAALALSPEQRSAYLARACGEDAEFRGRVEALLTAHAQTTGILETQAAPNPISTIALNLPLTEKPGDWIGRYKLLQQIGEGGCGVVYMAEQRVPVKRLVALKVIKPGMDTRQVLARFEAERQALALMDHPNIAKVLDAGATETGRPYFVMELVRGVKITDYCDDPQNNLPTEHRLALFIQVCRAVQHAHQKGIIHRDIKPSNILVTLQEDGAPMPKVIDFGIAKATAGQTLTDKTLFTAFEQFIGTPAYMSPEQAQLTAIDIDTRSDIYSLGVLLYELLIGQTPFDVQRLFHAGLDEIRRIIREEDPPRPSTCLSRLGADQQTTLAKHRQSDPAKLRHVLRGDLDWIVMKCLEKDRTRRYETANGLATDIERHLRNEPIIARPPSTMYRLQKTVRRNRLLFAASGAVACALVAGLAVSVVLLMSERAARNRAVAAEARTRAAQTQVEREQRQTEQALIQMQIQRAGDLFGADDSPAALAYLAHVLRQDPFNREAERAVAALSHRTFALPVIKPLRHEAAILSAQFSPDGRRIVTASGDNTVRVWDAHTGQSLLKPLTHRAPVLDASFSPNGLLIATASEDKAGQIWDANSGRPLGEPLRHAAAVRSVHFSPNGQQVVTASEDKTARVWDARTGQPITGPLEHGDSVKAGQFSPDGKWVVTASRDGTARVWDAQTGVPRTEPLRHENWVDSAEFSPDGNWIVASGGDTARVWDARTGKPITEPIRHRAFVYSVRFSPEGKRIVTACWDSTVRVWDACTGLPLTPPMRHRGPPVYFAEFSPDGNHVVTASNDKTARVWDARTGVAVTEPMRHGASVCSAHFSPDGQWLVTASLDHTALVWDIRAGRSVGQVFEHGGHVWGAQFSPDGTRIVTASEEGAARVWDAATGRCVAGPFKHESGVLDAKFSHDGGHIVTVSLDQTARVWDAGSGEAVTDPLPHPARVLYGHFSPDGHQVLTVAWDKAVRLWEVRSGRPAPRLFEHPEIVRCAQFSPDGRRIATGCNDNLVRVFDTSTGIQVTKPLAHRAPVTCLQFFADGQRLATASDDQTARIWDARDGTAITEPLLHGTTVYRAEFASDGQRLLTASIDQMARIWDLRAGRLVIEPLKHPRPVFSTRFSHDGQRVVTLAEDNVARIWDANTGQLLSEPLRQGGEVWPAHSEAVPCAEFSPNDQLVVAACADHAARIWEVPNFETPAPGWLPDLLEAIAGQRLNDRGFFDEVPSEQVFQVRRRLSESNLPPRLGRWARWFFEDRAERTISPFSPMTVAAFVQQRIDTNTIASLREALELSPTNALALARLSRLLVKERPLRNEVAAEADWYSRHAVALSPKGLEILRARAEVSEVLGKRAEATSPAPPGATSTGP